MTDCCKTPSRLQTVFTILTIRARRDFFRFVAKWVKGSAFIGLLPAILLVVAFGGQHSVALAGQERVDCSKPPELDSNTKQQKQDKDKKEKPRIQGSVAITIAEDGSVVEAKATKPVSDSTAKKLTDLAKTMKFKARPGCGPFKTVVNFNLAQ